MSYVLASSEDAAKLETREEVRGDWVGSWGRGPVFELELELELQEVPADLFYGPKATIANESPVITTVLVVEGQQWASRIAAQG